MSLTRHQPQVALDWPERWLPWRMSEWPEKWMDKLEELMKEMKVEEFEDDDTLVVRAELPGLDPEKDVEITLTDHTLSITAERRQESKTEEKKGFHSEFRYGSMMRTLTLPAGATAEDVKATYSDGILEVRVPITTGKPSHKVPVTRT